MTQRAETTHQDGRAGKHAPRFHVVGQASAFPPGSHRIVEINRQRIGIYNVGGTFHAMLNVCPHQFGPLCEGKVGGEMVCNADTDWKFQLRREGEIVICPWHGLEFDLKTGVCLATKDFRVRRFDVEVVADEVRVYLLPKSA